MKHVLSVLVNNSSGVLSHVSGLFTRRGYNIDSLSVGETDDKTRSVMTIVVDEDEKMVNQIEKQLYKLANVISINNLTHTDALKRELVLLTVASKRESRDEIIGLVDVFKASIVDVTENAMMIEMTGIPRRVSAFLNVMSEFGVISLARTGSIALAFPSNITTQNLTDD